MQRSLGTMTVSPLFPSDLPAPRSSAEVVSSFLVTSEGYAHRWLDARKGTLVLVMCPHDPASGSIYIYDRQRDFWFRLTFEAIDDTFTVESFEAAYKEYKLLSYIEQPGLLLNFIAEEERETAPAKESFSATPASSEAPVRGDISILMNLVKEAQQQKIAA